MLCRWGPVLLLAALVLSVSSQTNVIDLGYSQYQGAYDAKSNITSFLGIRYAAPPTGSLRWRPPQIPATLAGVQQANSESKECFQGSLGAASSSPFTTNRKRAVAQSEDCLFLNVYVSGHIKPDAQMPVVVWIHGGGYVSLSAAGYDGDLVTDGNGGVISVSIQYRLGIFGFLPGSEVKADGTLNVGLLDQQFALRWVHDHIAKFGGDPAKVTIWGQSAGAGSVLQHIVANSGQTTPSLFRAAITSSTYLPQQYNYNDAIPEAIYAQVLQLANCPSSQNQMTCLRALDSNKLSDVGHTLGDKSFFGTSIFVPVVDGDFIVKRPTEILHEGKINGDVLLAVTNTFEGRTFISPSASNLTDFVTNLFPKFGPDQIDATVKKYTGVTGLSSGQDQAIAVMGEAIFICPSYTLLEAFGDKAFKGQFAVSPANHGDDLEQYFPSGPQTHTRSSSFTKSFSQSFLAVVKSMDPNIKFDSADITPHWPAWDSQAGPTEMVFNVTETGEASILLKTTDSGLRERCSFWESMSSFIPQ